MSENKRFPLLRRLGIASLAAMLFTAFILVFFYRQDQLAEHERISVQHNEQSAIRLINLEGARIDAFVAASEGRNPQAMRNDPDVASFHSVLERVREHDILKLKIHNRSGATIYSSVLDEIGEADGHPDWVAKALSGETVHKVDFRDAFPGATGEMRGVYVAVTYRPIVYDGKSIGVIEIYQDATPIFEHLLANAIRIPLIVFGGFALLYAALYFYLRRTERSIEEWKQALQASENRRHWLEQQRLMQTSLDGFWVARAGDGHIIEANDAFCRMVGYSCEELLGMSIADLEAVESPEEIAAHIRKVMETGYDRFETRYRHKQGHLVHLEVSVSHSGQDGGVNLVFVRDITERKRMEQALAASEREFRSLAESFPDCIVRYDREGRHRYLNNTLIRLLGLSGMDEVAGKRPGEVWTDGRFSTIENAAAQAIEKGEIITIELVLSADDALTYNQIHVVPERDADGRIIGTIAFGRDITESRLAELRLLESESRFRSLFESATDCMLILDMEGRIVDINRTGHQRLGYSKQEMVGRPIAEFDTPEYAPHVAERLARFGKDGKVIFESAHVCKDGTVMPVEINTRMLFLDGELRYFSVIRDISARKQAEQQLRKLTEYLQTVREEEKTQFARELHDELGSTLSALKIEINLLNKGLSVEQKKLPLFARVESMVELFDNALGAMRRIITGLRPTLIEDLGLMAGMEWHAGQFEEHTGIYCRVECAFREARGCKDCKNCAYTSDKRLAINLFRIFQESLTNVARHSGASRVEVELHPGEQEIVLSVSDNGCGLPDGGAIASTSHGMRGMRERVELLKGRIEFGQPPGGGLRVEVRVPRSFLGDQREITRMES